MGDGVCQMGDACAFLHTDSAEALKIAKQQAASDAPHLLAPYFSFWHIHLGSDELESELIDIWHRGNHSRSVTLQKEVPELDLLLSKQASSQKDNKSQPQGTTSNAKDEKDLSLEEARQAEQERIRKKRQKTEGVKKRNRTIRE